MAEELNAGMEPEKPKGHMSTGLAIGIIAAAAILIGGGIWYWYAKTAVKDTSSVNIPSKSPSTSASASSSASSSTNNSSKNKTYTSTSTCISKFSFQYPDDWTLVKDYAVLDTENGGEGGSCELDIKFTKETEKNTFAVLNTQVRAMSNTVSKITLDDGVKGVSKGNTTFAELTAPPTTSEDITLGGTATKKYHLGGIVDSYFIGVLKNNTYYQIDLQDPDNIYKNDRGSKAGFDTIVSTWKFL